MLTPLQRQMMVEAQRMYPGKRISPVMSKTWEDSFVKSKGKINLWFNTPDRSTHVLTEDKFYGVVGKPKRGVC